jgi:uncharacterized repeat protein (TIGR01451 family)
MERKYPTIFIVFLFLVGLHSLSTPLSSEAAHPNTIPVPVLKWQNGGCYSSWCETGWYSSPAIADIDGDGTMEVIGATYSLFVLNGEDGSEQWTADPPGSRIWPGVVVEDLEGDGDLEIVVASGGGNVSVYDQHGSFEPGWPKNPATNEFRSLAVDDLDNDGDFEIAVGQARLDRVNVWVFEHDGTPRPGWPQQTTNEGSAAGLYNDNIGTGDLDGDGDREVVVPSDVITICAYDPDGTEMGTHNMYHGHPGHDMDYWGEVPAYIDLEYETRGWGPCYQEFTPRANFADGPANVVDVNGDGVNEVVVIGDVHNCNTSPYTDLYNTPYILNADRSRFNQGGFDWTTPPVNTGAPIIQNYNVIESVQPNPVTVDLDNDGNLEILYPSYDGKLHAFWLDKTEHGNWPYQVYNPGEGFYRFASEPVVADLDNNGTPEVIFGSWVQKNTFQTGKLHIVDNMGNPVHEVLLPAPYGSANWNGAVPAPTLGNIDNDPDLEIVLNTSHSGLVAYDLPGTSGAKILWGTGRGNYLRNGNTVSRTLEPSTAQVQPIGASPGEVLNYTLNLENPGPTLISVQVTDTLPPDVQYRGDLWASSGSYQEQNGVITWAGAVSSLGPVTISFSVAIEASITPPHLINNMFIIDDGQGNMLYRSVATIVGGSAYYFPIINNR